MLMIKNTYLLNEGVIYYIESIVIVDGNEFTLEGFLIPTLGIYDFVSSFGVIYIVETVEDMED